MKVEKRNGLMLNGIILKTRPIKNELNRLLLKLYCDAAMKMLQGHLSCCRNKRVAVVVASCIYFVICAYCTVLMVVWYD